MVVELYGPAVYRWCRRAGLDADDAADVGQEVFAAVARTIGSFRKEGPKDSFVGWLWTITRSKLLDHWRRREQQPKAAGGTTAQQRMLDVPESLSEDDEPGGAEGWLTIPGALLHQVRSAFKEQTWQAFWRVTVDGVAPADVAADVGLSVGAVYIAKSRVLHRLREVLGDLLDE
jgi:RNA polymerase sigma-70 factor (ECF subfamily)